MTEQQFETHFDAIATAIWEATTGSGRDIDESLWDSHMNNCQAAVNNSWTDDMSVEQWQAAALAWLLRAGA
jgi:hypothetical protein